MLRYMVQYHGQDILRKSIARLHDEGLYPHLQAYDEAALLYSDALDSVYAKFGEVLQKLPIPELADKRSEWRRWQLIYLTNRGQRNQPSILSLGADHELPIKYDEEVPLDQSIGIEKPNYRFRHLLLQEVASYPVWRRNMEQNLRESRVTHPTPPTIAMLEEESRHILYMLQNKIPTLSPSEQASKLYKFLMALFVIRMMHDQPNQFCRFTYGVSSILAIDLRISGVMFSSSGPLSHSSQIVLHSLFCRPLCC
ncbi:hypothetical protein PSTT_16958 [Puccinia striiformis]|uniref:Uncharacterized protein n=1 Tax=Puccinia striiformis TaxID=27350 RepID=A0A2S4UAK6_9BASI|nr:hypothetical protein PSTT_16958 [Puccinia striiformis]